MFPAEVRFTGSSLAFTLTGILGGSVTPFVAIKLAQAAGISWVGYYLAGASLFSLLALFLYRNDVDR